MEESNLIKHAKREFELAGWMKEPIDVMQQMAMDNILELLKVFSEQGHSGTSAPYILSHFDKLARFEIITPLTGNDEEWDELCDGNMQNSRMGSIFKDKDGVAYTLYGYVFYTNDDKSDTYTCKFSRKYITFPYHYEKPVYIKVPKIVDDDNISEEEYKSIYMNAIKNFEDNKENKND